MVELLRLLIVLILFLAGVVFFVVFWKKLKKGDRSLEVETIGIPGLVKATIKENPVRRIDFLTQPKDASGRLIELPSIKVKIFDDKNQPLRGRKVSLELESKSGTDILDQERISDDEGIVVFLGLRIPRTGQYRLIAKSEGQTRASVVFEITPPGMDTNIDNKIFGSPDYNDALRRKLMMDSAGDMVKINGEEI